MISDMENGEIGIIVTKDLSRLGRNQLHTGLYIEERFPMFGVRYIAINDNVDTDSSESNDLMPFKNLFNEWFIRDTSRKIRAVLKAKAERGERLGTRAPYGYRKDPDTKKLIVDEEAAAIVRRIFAMCAGGSGPSQIARILKKEQILTSTMYAYTRFGMNHTCLDTAHPYNWSGSAIANLLENEIYLGNTVNMKYSTKSYKDKRRVEHPREECMAFENTHPALITREVWDMVQRVRKNKRRLTKMEEQNKYSGLVFCADCGSNMVLHRAHTMSASYNHFTCRTYKKDGEACTGHYIRECVLDEIVLEDLRRVTSAAREHPEKFAAYIGSKQSAELQREIRRQEKELAAMRKRKAELDAIFKKLYEDSVLDRITTEQFQMLSGSYTEEQNLITVGIPQKENEIQRLRETVNETDSFLDKAKRYTDITELTPELLRLFIEKIVVHEKEVKWSKHAPQTVEIYYNGIGYVGSGQQDVEKGLCDLTETLCLSEEDVLMVPYLYTSKGTPYVQNPYTKDIQRMNNRSLSIRCAISSGAKDLRDTTLVNLKSIGETVLNGRYYRSYKDYRAEKMAADAVTVNRVAELKEEIQKEKQASEEWFRLLMDAYSDPSEE